MKIFAALPGILIICAGCASPQFIDGSGDAGQFILRQTAAHGGRTVATNSLPQVGGPWRYSEEDEAVIVRLPHDQFPALESFLRQSFGEPTIPVAKTEDGGKAGLFGAKAIGADLVFGCNRDETLVRIAQDSPYSLVPFSAKEDKSDFLVPLSESWEMPARAPDNHFALSAKLLPPAEGDTALRLAVELRNISDQTQRVIMVTNQFEGLVYLRAANGDVHEFIETRFWKMMMTSTWITPTMELPPEASCRFEHPLSDFMDDHRMTAWNVGDWSPISFPSLDAEFLPGCELRCAFRVLQWKMLADHSEMEATTAIVVSAPVRHP